LVLASGDKNVHGKTGVWPICSAGCWQGMQYEIALGVFGKIDKEKGNK
jgi:hypothetical protein